VKRQIGWLTAALLLVRVALVAAAKLRCDKKSGHYEIESFGNQYIKAANVRTWK